MLKNIIKIVDIAVKKCHSTIAGIFIQDSGEFWEDKYKNKWSKSTYSLTEAFNASKTMKQCRNCTDCIYCNRCVLCTDCQHCDNCYKCSNCIHCRTCGNARNFTHAANVTGGKTSDGINFPAEGYVVVESPLAYIAEGVHRMCYGGHQSYCCTTYQQWRDCIYFFRYYGYQPKGTCVSELGKEDAENV